MSLRRVISLLAVLTSTLAPRLASADETDPWWGRDKALHFGVSTGLGAGGYAVSSIFLDERWQRATAGAGFSLTLGASKELYDASGHGDPSAKDLTWDVAGTAVGVALAWLVDVLVSPREGKGGREAARAPGAVEMR